MQKSRRETVTHSRDAVPINGPDFAADADGLIASYDHCE